jgi:hypothetical protein
METVEIPRQTWRRRLDEFTAAHEGWLVSVDVLGEDIGAEQEVEDVPLIGVSMDRDDPDNTIDIAVARSSTEHLTHIVRQVGHIYVERTSEGADAAVEFESNDGTRTILRLKSPLRTELVDGVPPAIA